jgi:hypothetical protein
MKTLTVTGATCLVLGVVAWGLIPPAMVRRASRPTLVGNGTTSRSGFPFHQVWPVWLPDSVSVQEDSWNTNLH